MTCVNYVEYIHSYAHAIEPILRKLNFHANVRKMPVTYVRKVVMSALKSPDIRWTDKEQEFYDSIYYAETSQQIYYRCKNAVERAKEVFVFVDDEGNVVDQPSWTREER